MVVARYLELVGHIIGGVNDMVRITLTKDQRDVLLLTLIEAHTRNVEDDYQDAQTKRDAVLFQQLLKKL